MAFVASSAAIAAGVSLLPAVFKGISGMSQSAKGKRMNPIDPGFQMNNSVIGNAESLRNRYGNYTLPGYGSAKNDIESASANGFNNGVQGASSGADVLDLATRIAYGQSRSINDLNGKQAQGKEQAYFQQLQGNEAEGAQYQAKNAYDRDRYQQQLREKAALIQSGAQNTYGALDSASNVASSYIMRNKPEIASKVNAIQLDNNGNPINNGYIDMLKQKVNPNQPQLQTGMYG